MIKEIVIFGAGAQGKKAIKIIEENFDDRIVAVLDNYSYNYNLLGYKVIQAEEFLKTQYLENYYYIVSGRFGDVMRKQLIDAGISKEAIFNLEAYIVEKFNYNSGEKCDDNLHQNERIILFDCSAGFVLGGIEKWTYTIGNKLKERGYAIKFYTESMEYMPPNEFTNDAFWCDIKENEYDILAYLGKMNELLKQYQYVCCVLAHCNSFAYIAMILKKIFPERVKILSVIHSSLEYVIANNLFIEKYVDAFLCVNTEVRSVLENKLKDKSKVYFKETPIITVPLVREYQLHVKEKIRLGYAARLEVIHKRSDLLLVLIDELEKVGCNYELNIAGDGKCFDMISDYIARHKLQHKIKMLGRLDYSKMQDFWKGQDVAINVSETEGCSLSMLESMASGCVEIITDTVGTEWFVEQGINGYRVEIGDIKTMAEKIKYLENHRERLPVMGSKSYQIIKEKCDIKQYVDFFEKIIF